MNIEASSSPASDERLIMRLGRICRGFDIGRKLLGLDALFDNPNIRRFTTNVAMSRGKVGHTVPI
jgi:hypothetical protein